VNGTPECGDASACLSKKRTPVTADGSMPAFFKSRAVRLSRKC
jgi:hypothetical protein